jgi:hypothetical protein
MAEPLAAIEMWFERAIKPNPSMEVCAQSLECLHLKGIAD